MPDGIYLSQDRVQQLNGDLFEQNARQTLGDVWEQQASAAAPGVIAQAQKEADDRARAQMQLEQAQRDHMATSFETAAPNMAAQHLASLNADVAPSPQEAPQPAPAPDMSQTAPDYAAPTPAPAQSQPAPFAPVTAPMSSPAATQQPISASAAATPTTAGISGGGDLSGRVGAAGQAIMSAAADAASWLGDQGQKALQAVLLTEGGLNKARGDNGQSVGPLQFYTGGQLANFAAQHGLTQSQAMAYVEQNPEAAVQWAIGTPDQPGYLGRAILAGQQAGLQGPDLATYAQQHGQVSVSPERAGQNWQSLFGQGADVISGAASGALRVVNAAVQNVLSLNRPSQFGVGLSAADAYAACGPVAAMAFAKATGREPTIDEAMQLAKSVGWSAAQGMAGPSSEVELLKKMGVASHLEAGADPNKIAQDVNSGNPVIISTPGHYFTADGARTAADGTQEFHVGTSGTDLRRGSEWMSLAQMQQTMGAIQGTLYMDRKPGDGPSVAVQQGAQQAAAAVPGSEHAIPGAATPAQPQGPLDAFKQKLGDAFSDLFAPLQNLFGGSSSTPPAPEGGGYGAVPPGGVNPLPDIFAGIGQAAQVGQQNLAARGIQLDQPGSQTLPGVQHSLADVGIQLDQPGSPTLPQTPLTSENFPSVLDPNHPANVYTDLAQKYAAPSDPLNLHVRDRMTPEDQAKWDSLAAQVGGVEMPTLPTGGQLKTGAGILQDAMSNLGQYPAEVTQPIRDWAQSAQATGTAPSSIGATVQRWMAENPVSNFAQAPTLGRDVAETLPPGSGPLAAPAPPQESVDTLQGLLGMAKSRGLDTSTFEAQLPKAALPVEVGGGRSSTTSTVSDLAGSLASPKGVPGVSIEPYAIEGKAVPEFGQNVVYRDAAGNPQGILSMILEKNGQPKLLEVAVNPEVQGQGIATGLYDAASKAGYNVDAATGAGGYSKAGHALADSRAVGTRQPFTIPAADSETGVAQSILPAPAAGPAGSPTMSPPAAATPGGPLNLTPVTTGGAAPPTILPTAAPPVIPPAPPAGTLPAAVGAVPPSVPTGGANAWDYLRALRVGSLAGGIQTVSHILLNAPLQTAFKLVSDAPLSITRPETVPLEFMGAWQGLRGWASNAASAPLGQSGKIAQSIGGTTGQAVETGLLGLVKTHPVIQDMARQIGTGMELWRQAGVEASNAGLTRFSGPWWTEVQNLVANPTADMAASAQRAGDTFSLGGKMGEVGQAFANLRQDSKAVDFIMPFFNIGYHVATQGIERSPIGLLGTALDVARAPLGSGPYAAGRVAEGVTPLAQRFRNNMVGVGLAVEAYHQASQGNITGNGPDDPKLKQDLLATGWQPDSVRVGGRYFPLHVLGPLGWPLAEAANLYEATHTGEQGGYAKPNADPQGQFASYLGRMAQFGENETFLRSIGQLLQAAGNAKDFGRLGEQEAASTLGSLIPQGALLSNIASTTDPFTRRAAPGDIGQAIQNRLPGLRQDLPLKLTPTGQPVQNPSQGLGILLPRSSLAAPDPVINAMGQAGVGAPTIPKTIPVTSKYQMDLTQDEQQRWQELHGQALNEQLKDVVTDPDWAKLTQDRQRQLIQKALTKASDVARKQLLDEMPDAQIESRVQLKTDAASANRVTVGSAP